MYRFPSLPSLLAITLCLYSSLSTAIDTGLLRLATTSSVQNCSLLEPLIQHFEQESDYRVKIYVVGSGAALRMGRTGLADAIISHSSEEEELFMQEGHGAVRRQLMHNDFVLVGPAGDPAGISGLTDSVQALIHIAMREYMFVSRADESGTHKRERNLWRTSGFNPFGKPWYREAGMGMGDALRLGDELQAYMLVDRGTWLAMRSTLKLVLMSFGDPRLNNAYSVISVSRNSHREVNEKAGRAFVDSMTSKEVQALIGAFRMDGERLFTPANSVR